METKQTAVEWLEKRYKNNINLMNYDFNQAKEMEKQQLEKCAIYFTNYAIDTIEGKKEINGEKQFEQYYNEKFINE